MEEAKLVPLTIRTQRLHDGNDARRGERSCAVEGWIEPGKTDHQDRGRGKDGGDRVEMQYFNEV